MAGALAALSAAAWFDFLLTRPYGRFTISDGSDIRTAVPLLIVGLIVSQLAVRTRRLQRSVITDASDLSRVEGTALLARCWTMPRGRPKPRTGPRRGRKAKPSCAPSAAGTTTGASCSRCGVSPYGRRQEFRCARMESVKES
ncbi:DUF4118 domain-containing protein [Streptomyces sp. RerS4]|uniref:DUF4118 domain-containing protein n=1 Tax=Streptomyces sp. RerS4 TaxID=2942449 RepID=UPI00201BF6E1|nr:DUF4118 domain-containing protein [Streptomyces sp. RerS4]UQX04132.1 DUF4118 domain-containing protein [Streptomyces sp. RerS4]